jgi:DNA mismatch repair protein MutS2
MDSQSLQSLEFDRILQHLARFTVTNRGRWLAEKLTPTSAAETLELRQALLLQSMLIRQSGGDFPIDGHREIDEYLEKSRPGQAFLHPDELLILAGNMRIAVRVRSFYQNRRNQAPNLADIAYAIAEFGDLADAIDKVIDDGGQVRDNASPELKRLRSDIRRAEDRIRSRLASQARTLAKEGYTQEGDIVTVKGGRAVIALRDEFRSRVQGVVHHVSASGSTVFVEPLEILEANNQLDRLRAEEEREVARILAQLTAQVGGVADELEANEDIFGDLDLAGASACLAGRLQGIIPAVGREHEIRLDRARHPLLLLKQQDDSGIVPLSVTLDAETAVLVITGPNAGGKTVAMKTVGLLAVMAHAGLAVPADDTTAFPLLSNIFCDVGDQQSLEDDLSTFSSRIQRYKILIDEANGQTLALLDEIGQGTDPQEGGAIAMAMLEHLANLKAFAVVTTHHTVLKVFARNTDHIINGSMAFDAEHYAPTYQFQPGVPGSSFALEISERMQMSSELLTRARALLGAEHLQLDGLLRDLEQRLNQVREDKTMTAQARRSAEMLERKYQDKLTEVEQEYKQQVQKRVLALEKQLKDANKRVEQAIKEVRETGADKTSIKKAHTAASKAKQTLDKTEHPSEEPPSEKLLPGSKVFISSLQTEGVIESMNLSTGKVRLKIGKKKVEMDMRDLETPAKKPKSLYGRPVHHIPNANVSDELDMRGMDRIDAEQALDHYLEAAVNAGHMKVTIIHGLGTGVLRRMVGEYLTGHPLVAGSRLGRAGEGSGGATIVELN